MEPTFSAFKYLENQFFGKNVNQIHSPFVFDFFNEVFRFPYTYYCFETIEKERHALFKKNQLIQYQNLGSGRNSISIKISDLAVSSLMSAMEAQILFRLARWLKAKYILELGGSLGITTSYLAQASGGKVYSFEGIPEIAEIAQKTWNNLKIKTIVQIPGKIEDSLPRFLNNVDSKIDLAIIDANHQFQATINNFEMLLPHLSNSSCLVFHDIYWSREMAKAWSQIEKRPEVSLSVDIYKMGIVFFRKESTKQHFKIRW